ncbi:OmpA family protein [Rhizobium sp. TRM95111]|uniref:OmpA family protein n=1 Tax=Rhizobium alarense TaxID=2846851 RepID=UPI001F469915|nr:OmpA family protein [Rhizobium alarense]MCF3641088.1 OmpA family protein [Rhizobium alarense]
MLTTRCARIALLAVLLAPGWGAAADDAVRDPWTAASADEIARGLIPAFSKTRGLLVETTPIATNSYGDALAATVNLAVEFEFNSAALTEKAATLLDALGEALGRPELAQYRFVLGGHTDAVGSDTFNLDLSRQRAETTARFLAERYGVGSERLVLRAFGETALLLPDRPDDARNRRVEVSTLAPEATQ